MLPTGTPLRPSHLTVAPATLTRRVVSRSVEFRPRTELYSLRQDGKLLHALRIWGLTITGFLPDASILRSLVSSTGNPPIYS